MDAEEFLDRKTKIAKPGRKIWCMAIIKTLSGATLLWGIARLFPTERILIIGWVGALGLLLFLFFWHLSYLCPNLAAVWNKRPPYHELTLTGNLPLGFLGQKMEPGCSPAGTGVSISTSSSPYRGGLGYVHGISVLRAGP
jgi:hypothetical protein